MIRLISIVVATLLLCYIVFVLFFFRGMKQDMLCQSVQVELTDSEDRTFIKEDDILAMLKKANMELLDKPMKRINTDRIERELMKNEAIANVEVYKTPSGLVKIEVRQKNPILRIISVRGNYYVDDRGAIMPASRRYTAYVPIASGYVEKELAKTDLYKFALFLQKNSFWNDQIEQIYVHPDGDVDLIPRVGNHRIALGSFEKFEEKLENLQLFYKQAVPKVGWDKYSVISLKYKNQIVCTKK